jgi:hypothetical protein
MVVSIVLYPLQVLLEADVEFIRQSEKERETRIHDNIYHQRYGKLLNKSESEEDVIGVYV